METTRIKKIAKTVNIRKEGILKYKKVFGERNAGKCRQEKPQDRDN